jgi:hypothetical protein
MHKFNTSSIVHYYILGLRSWIWTNQGWNMRALMKGWSHRPVKTPSVSISGYNNMKSGGPTSIYEHNSQQFHSWNQTKSSMWSGHETLYEGFNLEHCCCYLPPVACRLLWWPFIPAVECRGGCLWSKKRRGSIVDYIGAGARVGQGEGWVIVGPKVGMRLRWSLSGRRFLQRLMAASLLLLPNQHHPRGQLNSVLIHWLPCPPPDFPHTWQACP